jgi:hypothetical protein
MSIEAMKMALHGLQDARDVMRLEYKYPNAYQDEITALRQAIERAELAKPEQEPVAYVSDGNLFWHEHVLTTYAAEMNGKDLFTAPPQREWVGLTTDELVDLYCQTADETERAIDNSLAFARLIQAHLKGLNLHSFAVVPVAKREWVGLTWDDMPEEYAGHIDFMEGAKWAIAKLKEKNGG